MSLGAADDLSQRPRGRFRYAGTLCRENPWHQAGHLPIEQVSKFTFMINLKTAKALGMTVPPALLSPADEIIA
jgi:putative ABC transport system substrate-binding protein